MAEQAPPQQPGPQPPPPPRRTGSELDSEDPKAAKLEISTCVSVDSQSGQICFDSRLENDVSTSNVFEQSSHEYS